MFLHHHHTQKKPSFELTVKDLEAEGEVFLKYSYHTFSFISQMRFVFHSIHDLHVFGLKIILVCRKVFSVCLLFCLFVCFLVNRLLKGRKSLM